MRIAAISDLHGQLPADIPEGVEAIIIAGDICPDYADDSTMRQYAWLAGPFAQWLCAIPRTIPIYMTWGNHDWTQGMKREIEEYWPPMAFMLVDQVVSIENRKVWFSPWCQNLPGWAWNISEPGALLKYGTIPDDTDIIVSHAPPYGAGDSLGSSALKYGLARDERVGSRELVDVLQTLPGVRHIICGHIHEDRGDYDLWFGPRCVKVHNVASVDGNYVALPERWTLLEI